ncbi:MAG: hypothetical protein ABW321_21305 [Polyangiales bacterium]
MRLSIRELMWRSVVPALLLGASSVQVAQASNPERRSCPFDDYAPIAVRPYSHDENLAYGRYSFLRGAQLYIPAREGLTKEWLTASVQHSLATAAHSCSPNVKDVQVYVSSAGHGFWVQLIGRDERAGHLLLTWARGLLPLAR